MLLEAAAPLARAGKVRVDIIGDGPELPALKALAHRENMGDAVEFAGWVEHRELTARLQKCQVFGFPSVREFGGGSFSRRWPSVWCRSSWTTVAPGARQPGKRLRAADGRTRRGRAKHSVTLERLADDRRLSVP